MNPVPELPPYTLTVRYPSMAYEGCDIFISVKTDGSGTYSTVECAVPLGAEFAMRNPGNSADGKVSTTTRKWTIYNSPSVAVVFRYGKMPLGSHTLKLVCTNWQTKQVAEKEINITVVAPPGLPKNPALKKWEAKMIEGAVKFGDPTYNFGTFSYEGHVWFYDGGRVFFQIADYLGEKKYEATALNLLNQYADYIIKVNGILQGWRVFTKGLLMAYWRTSDEKFKTAIKLLATNSNASRFVRSVGDWGIRENSYAINSYVDAELAGYARDPRLKVGIELTYGYFDYLFKSNNYEIHQGFYDGIAAMALINAYSVTKDQRIVCAIKQLIDWHIAHGWDYAQNIMYYRYALNTGEPSGDRNDNGLINLIAPAFAWYYSLTGDAQVRTHYDLMFSHSNDSNVTYNGKQFSQNYQYSFLGVKWRYGQDCQNVGSLPA